MKKLTKCRNEKSQKVPAKLGLPACPTGMDPEKQASKQPAPVIGSVPAPQKNIDQLKDTLEKWFCVASGVNDQKLAEILVVQMRAIQTWCPEKSQLIGLIHAGAAIREMSPKNAHQALLAVQMFGVHHAAITFLTGATLKGQTEEGADASVARATRLMRLFMEQGQAMAKLQGKASQQKVTVEHVHVHSGGQAVVGVLEGSKKEKPE